jgi:hypothetical protein
MIALNTLISVTGRATGERICDPWALARSGRGLLALGLLTHVSSPSSIIYRCLICYAYTSPSVIY